MTRAMSSNRPHAGSTLNFPLPRSRTHVGARIPIPLAVGAVLILGAPVHALEYADEILDRRERFFDHPGVSASSCSLLVFGSVDGNGFAVADGVWNWDHGLSDPLEGWVANDPDVGVNDASMYSVEDFCVCDLSGNVLEFHNSGYTFDRDHRAVAMSNPVDLLGLPAGFNRIEAVWDMYADLPFPNGVFFRPGWMYFAGGVWSERVGPTTFEFSGETPKCHRRRTTVGTDHGVPQRPFIDQVRLVFEVYSSCDAFGVPSGACLGVPGPSPLFDNVQIRIGCDPVAPRIALEPGGQLQDAYSFNEEGGLTEPGNADITRNVAPDGPLAEAGDVLLASGPRVTDVPAYKVQLAFRIAREGPGAAFLPSYTAWKNRVGDGHDITGGEFVFCDMDTYDLGSAVQDRGWAAYFAETDDDFDEGAGEHSPGNEIIPDGILPPGTRIEYYLRSFYIALPGVVFTLPDITTDEYYEFEILPGWSSIDGPFRFPCTLYIDAYNRGGQELITTVLDTLEIEHDRYDYFDAAANWSTPMERGFSNGIPLEQLLWYRTVIVSTGPLSAQAMQLGDFELLRQWLEGPACEGSAAQRHGLILNGDNTGSMLAAAGATLLSDALGVTDVHTSYNLFAEDYGICVGLPASAGAVFPPVFEYDGFGNWCSGQSEDFAFDVLAPVGTGVANRDYENALDAHVTTAAEVVNDAAGAGSTNYRSVIDGYDWRHLQERDHGAFECELDEDRVFRAVAAELDAALQWIFDGEIPNECDTPCESSDVLEDAVPGAGVRFESAPNPFVEATTLRFSLPADEEIRLEIFDAAGRKVRTLRSGACRAGTHDAIWDGRDDQNRAVPSGNYWSRLRVGDRSWFGHVVRVQ